MDIIWNNDQLLAALGCAISGTCSISRVIIDSRNSREGDLFVALSGQNVDGHNFVADAYNRSANAVLVTKKPSDAFEGLPFILVDNTTQALTDLARYKRQHTSAKIIGVTGSAGKTSTKEQLNLAFSSQGLSFASQGNYNNELGVPLSLANMPGNAEYAIFEMGMNHEGEIKRLSNLVRPDIAIITTVAPAHLEFFKSVSGIADAKAEIFHGMSQSGIAILNLDNEYFEHIAAIAKQHHLTNILSFGAAKGASARLVSYHEQDGRSLIKADICGQIIEYKLAGVGLHLAQNSLATLAAIYADSGDVQTAASALQHFAPLKGRGQQQVIEVDGKSITLIDDSYNANPASIKAALKVLSGSKTAGRTVAILSDMRELGDSAAQLHIDLAADIKEKSIDQVIAVGPLMSLMFAQLPSVKQLGCYRNVEELLPLITSQLCDNDVVLVKGSFGTALYKLVEHLTRS